MKKKIILIVVLLLVLICNSIVALADSVKTSTWDGSKYTGEGSTGTQEVPDIDGVNKDVIATFAKDGEDVISVNIQWGSLEYKYYGEVKWNGSVYEAHEEQEGPWIVDDTPTGVEGMTNDQIFITNNSEVDIDTSVELELDKSKISSGLAIVFVVDGDGGALSPSNREFDSNANGVGAIFKLDSKAMNTNAINKGIIRLMFGNKPIFSNNFKKNDLDNGIVLGNVTITLYENETN